MYDYAYQKYGIEVGQLYTPADGSTGMLEVTDVDTFQEIDDVVVKPVSGGDVYRIDAFKLAMVRYNLVKE